MSARVQPGMSLQLQELIRDSGDTFVGRLGIGVDVLFFGFSYALSVTGIVVAEDITTEEYTQLD